MAMIRSSSLFLLLLVLLHNVQQLQGAVAITAASSSSSSPALSSSTSHSLRSRHLNHEKNITQNGNDVDNAKFVQDDDEFRGDRVLIHKFDVLLSPSEFNFQTVDLTEFHDLLDRVIGEYISENTEMGVVMDYVLLGAIASMQESNDENVNTTVSNTRTRLMLGTGIVNFNLTDDSTSTTTTPTVFQVNSWVKEAVNGPLMDALRNTNKFGSISSAIYVEQVDFGTDPDSAYSPDGDNSTGLGDITNDPNNGGQQQATSSSANALLISLCVVGAALLVASVGLVALVHRRRRNKNGGALPPYMEQHNPAYSIKEMMEDTDYHYNNDSNNHNNSGKQGKKGSSSSKSELNTTKDTIALSSSVTSSPNSSPYKRGLLQSYYYGRGGGGDNHTVDGKSVAGESESEFTVNTEAGDSMALQSLSSPNTLFRRGSQNGRVSPKNNDIASTESFERERTVSLQKDMLTSSWVGQVLLRGEQALFRGGSTGGLQQQQQSDSVLRPSHFTASEEKHQHRYYESNSSNHQESPRQQPSSSTSLGQQLERGEEVEHWDDQYSAEGEHKQNLDEEVPSSLSQQHLFEHYERDGSVSLGGGGVVDGVASPTPTSPSSVSSSSKASSNTSSYYSNTSSPSSVLSSPPRTPPSQMSRPNRTNGSRQPHPYHRPSPGDVV